MLRAFPLCPGAVPKLSLLWGILLGCPSDGVANATAVTYRIAWGEMRTCTGLSAVNAYIFGFALHGKESERTCLALKYAKEIPTAVSI